MLATASMAAICVDGDTNKWIECSCPNTEPGQPRFKAGANTEADNTGCGTITKEAFDARITLADPALVPVPNGVQQPTAGVPIGLYDDAGVASTITAVWASNTTPGIIPTSNVTFGGVTYPERSVSSETLAIAALGTVVPAANITADHPCASAAVTGLFDFVELACAIPYNATATTIHCGSQTLRPLHTDVVAVWGMTTDASEDPVCYWVAVDDTALVYNATASVISAGVPLRGGNPLVAVTGVRAVGPSLDGRRIVAATDTDVVVFDIATGAEVNRTAWTAGTLTLAPATAPVRTLTTLGCALPGSPCSDEVVCCARTLPLQTAAEAPVVSVSPLVAVHPTQLNQPIEPLPVVNVSFYGASSSEVLSDNVPADPIVLPSPREVTQANVTGRRAMGFNQPGGDAALRALLENCDLTKCAQCDQSRIARDDSTPLTFAERDPTVRGQNATKSVLGAYYRDGTINEYDWLTTRGGDWAVPPSFPFDTRQDIWGGAPYDPANRSTAFWNRWYVNQATTSGTPLWPTSVKSDFGLCCAYLYAAYGTNGYRPYEATSTPPRDGLKTTEGVSDTSERNAGQLKWKDLAQFPPFPEAFDAHSQCYTGGLDLTAGLSADQEAQACDTTFGRPLPPVGCRQPFNESDWMSDDEKKIARLYYPTGYNQTDFLTSALWPAEGCMTDYDCELPQLAVLQPGECTTDINTGNCKLCTNMTNATVPTNCMPARETLTNYILPIPVPSVNCGKEQSAHCDDFADGRVSCIVNNEPEKTCVGACRKSEPVGRNCEDSGASNCVGLEYSCYTPPEFENYGIQYAIPFVFGVPDGTGNFTVPGIDDTVSPFLQRRAYAQCRACSGRAGGKCCDASAYTKWRALSAFKRFQELNNIYQLTKTQTRGQPAKTTRQYPFVWGGKGADVNFDRPTFPPIFPPNAFMDTLPMECDVVTEELPLGCATNVSNIAHKANSTVAKRTIIRPQRGIFNNAGRILRPGATTCPIPLDSFGCRSNASASTAWSNPVGCYNDMATGRIWFSDGTGDSPIPNSDSRAFHLACVLERQSLEEPAVQCSGPEKFHVDFFDTGSPNVNSCDEPTDWRCRLTCT